MPPKGGSKQRFARSLGDQATGEGVAPKASPAQAPRGGARRSFLAARDAESRGAEPVLPPERKGDLRREEKAGASSESSRKRATPFSDDLKEDWGKGHISSVRALKYARSASAQGAHSLEPMARAATGGENPQNAQRDLMRVWGPARGAPIISWYKIPTTAGELLHQFFLPHLFFFQSLFCTSACVRQAHHWRTGRRRAFLEFNG